MVDVILAGHNVDVEILKEYKEVLKELKRERNLVFSYLNSREFESEDGLIGEMASAQQLKKSDFDPNLLERLDKLIEQELTPETISAAYARISRDAASVTTLRKRARKRVPKARKSNEHIVYGLGHASVAEHANFNLDILNLSRLATEWLQAHRLCSYTEKSQRYITLKEDDFMTPQEMDPAGIGGENLKKMLELRGKKKELYFEALEPLFNLQKAKHPEMVEEKIKTLEGWAKEDARYCVDLTTVVQMGMTASARNIEKLIQTGRHHPLQEVRELSQKVYQTVYEIAPSLLSKTNAEDFEEAYEAPLEENFLRWGREDARKAVEKFLGKYYLGGNLPSKEEAVKLIRCSSFDPDKEVVNALLFNNSGLRYWDIDYLNGGSNVKDSEHQIKIHEKMITLVKELFQNLSQFDAVPREFEMLDFTYELVTSASCFAQLKRHRMTTQLMQDYDPNLGYMIPEAVKEIGFEEKYRDIMGQSSELFYQIQKTDPDVAPYVLTNGHKRRVLVKANTRSLYHFSRLREDGHAQWDIRNIAHKMLDQAKEKAPITLMLATGKDRFDDLKKKVYE